MQNISELYFKTKCPICITLWYKVDKSLAFFIISRKILQKVTSDIYVDGMRNKISDQFTSSDPEYYGSHSSWPEDHGTENIAVIDTNGNAVVVTSTINMAYVFTINAWTRV